MRHFGCKGFSSKCVFCNSVFPIDLDSTVQWHIANYNLLLYGISHSEIIFLVFFLIIYHYGYCLNVSMFWTSSLFFSLTSLYLLIVGIQSYCCTWSYSMTHTHTHARTRTLGRNPRAEGSARRREHQHTTLTSDRHPSPPPAEFESANPASERPQTYALDRVATALNLWSLNVVSVAFKKYYCLTENLLPNYNDYSLDDVNGNTRQQPLFCVVWYEVTSSGSVTWRGNTIFTRKSVSSLITLKVLSPFKLGLWRHSRTKLFRNRGYLVTKESPVVTSVVSRGSWRLTGHPLHSPLDHVQTFMHICFVFP